MAILFKKNIHASKIITEQNCQPTHFFHSKVWIIHLFHVSLHSQTVSSQNVESMFKAITKMHFLR